MDWKRNKPRGWETIHVDGKRNKPRVELRLARSGVQSESMHLDGKVGVEPSGTLGHGGSLELRAV
eukprot:7133258-Prymnesium_polylepis.1